MADAVAEQAVAEQAVVKQPPTEKSAAVQVVVEKAAVRKSAVRKAAVRKAARTKTACTAAPELKQASLFDAGDLDACAAASAAGAAPQQPGQARSSQIRFGHGPAAGAGNRSRSRRRFSAAAPETSRTSQIEERQFCPDDQPSPHLVAARRLVREMRRSKQDPQLRQAKVRALCGELLALLDEPIACDLVGAAGKSAGPG